MWAVGIQLRKFPYTGAQGLVSPEGSSAVSDGVEGVEEQAHPAECSTTARIQEDGPVIWEARVSPREVPGRGDPANKCSGGRADVDAGAARTRTGVHLRGSAFPRGTRGACEGAWESEGRIRATTSGNGLAPGPGRAKAARADVSFWRET